MKSWIKNCLYIILTIIVVGLCFVPFIWNECFFGQKTTIAETLKYIGAFIGGILLAVNAFFIYKRVKEQNRNNNLVAKGQLDTRFKDAATLLASGNTSAELSGIHALHQIAIEAFYTDDQQDYVRVIRDILTAFIKENSNIQEGTNAKSKIVLETIIDKLFSEEVGEIYGKCIDLSETVLKKVNFECTNLRGAIFREAQLQDAIFWDASLDYVDFSDAQLRGTDFFGAYLTHTNFAGAELEYANFENADDINKAIFIDTYYDVGGGTYWNEQTNFKRTAFENKTIDELTEIMKNSPTPLE